MPADHNSYTIPTTSGYRLKIKHEKLKRKDPATQSEEIMRKQTTQNYPLIFFVYFIYE